MLQSLRFRLLAGAGLTILLALAISGAGIIWLFERHIERREAVSMEAKARELIGSLAVDGNGRPKVIKLPSDNRFSQPASGLYWQVSTPRGLLHSASLWDQDLSLPKVHPDQWTLRRALGAFGGHVLILERQVQPDATRRPVLVQMATDDSALREARREFIRETILSLVLLWIVLTLAAYAQVTLGLRPLRPLRRELEHLRSDPKARMSGRHPREIAPLIDAINALADARSRDVERARYRASDLAHSLKTPLAAMSAQSRRARDTGAVDAADGLDRAIAATAAALEAELARARANLARSSDRTTRAEIGDVAERVILVMERTERGERLVFDVDVDPGTKAPLAPDSLAEMLGALVENAARYARRQIRITAKTSESGTIMCVSDDGPGIADDYTAQALSRGRRLDERGSGYGLGLAIVRDLAEATDGALALRRGDLGGLEVVVSWPALGDDT